METVFQWVGIFGVTLALVVAFVVWVWRVIVTFDSWGKRGATGIERETLGLPRGAVRTFLMLAFTSLALYALFAPGLVSPGDKKWILAELGGIISFYFISKIAERR